MIITLLFRYLLSRSLLLLVGGLTSVALHAQPQALIAALPDVHRDYRLFLGSRQISDITNYSGTYSRRDVIELVLMQQALTLGGFKHPVKIVDDHNYFRSIRNLIDGKTLSVSNTIWHQDLINRQEHLHISTALVKEGQFVVGFYTSPANKRALSSKTLAQLTQLKVVTSRQWKPDMDTLNQLGFDKVMYTPSWSNIARMLNVGRVDIALSPIANTPGKELLMDGITLVPIEGIKVAISGSRHWAVSKKHALGDEFYHALRVGLEQLQRSGTIVRAYRESGFFHPDLAQWTLLTTHTDTNNKNTR